MSGALKPIHVEEAVELAEQQAGNTKRTLVPIPEAVADSWGLTYDEYVRISLSSKDGQPRLAIAPMGDLHYRHRNNDLKLSSNDAVALPRRIVRAFGLAGDVWWEEFDEQLVGTLTEYNDERVLRDVVSYYTSQSLPEEDGKTSFSQLRGIAEREYQYSENNPHGIVTHRGAVRHTVPDDMGLEDGDELVFVLFHDGTDFVVGLIPHEPGEEDEETPFFKYQYNPMSASPGSLFEQLPSVLLDYEKDRVGFHRDRNDTLYYTVPKQVASCLWLDDGYNTNWLKVGDAYLSKLVPKSRRQAEARVDPSTIPE